MAITRQSKLGKLTRRAFMATFATGGAGLASFTYARYLESDWFEVSQIKLDAKKFPAPRGLRILHLSDLHYGPYVPLEMIDDAIDLGLAERPDLIALTGDYVTGRVRDAEAYTRVLARLSAAAPTFACLGNHDAVVATQPIGEIARTAAIVRVLRAAKIHVLINETHEIMLRGARLRVSGLGDLWTGQNLPARCLKPIREPKLEPHAHLLLNHNPDARLGALPYHWDLMLCGHTHGGQLGLPGIAEWLAPVQDSSHIEGLRERSNRLIYITRGVGNLYGMRILCRPEVSILVVD